MRRTIKLTKAQASKIDFIQDAVKGSPVEVELYGQTLHVSDALVAAKCVSSLADEYEFRRGGSGSSVGALQNNAMVRSLRNVAAKLRDACI